MVPVYLSPHTSSAPPSSWLPAPALKFRPFVSPSIDASIIPFGVSSDPSPLVHPSIQIEPPGWGACLDINSPFNAEGCVLGGGRGREEISLDLLYPSLRALSLTESTPTDFTPTPSAQEGGG